MGRFRTGLFFLRNKSDKIRKSRHSSPEQISLKSVIHYLRKRRPNANYSLEFIFEDVRRRLEGFCKIKSHVAPHESSGVFARLLILWDVFRVRNENIHVTGDINFAVLGTRRQSAVLTMLDCGFMNRSKGFRRWILKYLWLRWPVKWSACTTTISQSAKDEIIDWSGCNPEKVVVIPVAISEGFTSRPREFDRSNPRILHIGTAPNKNLGRHIEAVRGLECTLVVLGVIDENNLRTLQEHNIRFENHVELTLDEVIGQYARADLLCFASTHEGFGMPILEAHATGRPVVTSNISSMPEVAGDAALFVDPLNVEEIRSAILRICDEPELRDQLILKGFDNVKRFNPEEIARQYYEVYRRVWG